MKEKNRYGKLLPIGSIVKLKKIDKKIMILGILSLGEDSKKNKLYDYAGCFFPEGCLTENKNILFDQEDIKEIIYKGYIDNDEIKFKENINDYFETLKSAVRKYKEEK